MKKIRYVNLGLATSTAEFSKKELDKIIKYFKMIDRAKSIKKKNKYENIIRKMHNKKCKIKFNKLSVEQKISLLGKKGNMTILVLPYKNL